MSISSPGVADPHHHLWDVTQHTHPWLEAAPDPDAFQGDMRPLYRSYLISDFLRDAATVGVTRSVYVECGWDPGDPMGELRWVQSIADAHGFPQGIVAFAELEESQLERRLDEYAAFRNVRGVRQTLNWHPNPRLSIAVRSDLLDDPQWQRGLDLLGRRGLSLELSVYPGQLIRAAAVAARHPNTRLILNHAGMPVDRDAAGIATWRRGMYAIAAEPNVSVKISGLGMFDHAWSVDSIRPFVLGSIDAFGTDRSMFASNFPVDSLYSDYASLFRAFDEIVAAFSADERRRLFFDNAVATYRL